MAQHLKQEWPSDRVKSFGNVDFQQEARAPAGMKKPSSGLDHPETVLDVSPFYERALCRVDEGTQSWRQAVHKNLGEKFSQNVDHGDRSVILQ